MFGKLSGVFNILFIGYSLNWLKHLPTCSVECVTWFLVYVALGKGTPFVYTWIHNLIKY